MFKKPEKPLTIVFFGAVAEAANLHAGQSFSERLEKEIALHEGQIQAENLLLNTIAHYQKIAARHDIPREELNDLFKDKRYDLDAIQETLVSQYGIERDEFDNPIDFEAVNTADYMRQRASMIGAILSSTPVLLRDPWDGKPVTSAYGFSDFKAEVDGISFSAVATPRHKGIPFRFAVMKHEHDGYVDNNPAMIMSSEFCDAFEQYNKDVYGDIPPEDHPLISSMATNMKPSVHDRFHNWLLYDVEAASDVFKQWTDDIYLVEHTDKNKLLINYEYVALCFHLYGYQVLFHKNPELKDEMYDTLEECADEIAKFGAYLKETGNPNAEGIEEMSLYAVVSNLAFVLDPFEPRFQAVLDRYPDVKEKLLEVRQDGRGVGAILERLHGYEDGVPSLKYGGAKEAAIEYILRYPLADEIRERLAEQRSGQSWNAEIDGNLPAIIADHINNSPDPDALLKVADALDELPVGLRQECERRIEVTKEGYVFFRMDRDEIDYTSFANKEQKKRVLLVDIPEGQTVEFTNNKKLSISAKVAKQDFCLEGGKHVLAINVSSAAIAKRILERSKTEGSDIVDPAKAVKVAQKLAAITGDVSVGDLYTMKKEVAQNLYGFDGTAFYKKTLSKALAQAPGPIVMEIPTGDHQRLIKGAFVYIGFDKDPETDSDPDCHLIENTDFKHDYEDDGGTDTLPIVGLKPDTPLTQYPGADEAVKSFMRKLHEVNFQITHGPEKTALFFSHEKANVPGLFT